MKANLDKDGILTIKPETQLENYAMVNWMENFAKSDNVPKKEAIALEEYGASIEKYIKEAESKGVD
jgi:hypothetical protein